MADILTLEPARVEFVLGYAVRLIQAGKVVAFPTDTIYGLGADPFNLAAVNEIFRIKRRAAERPIPLLVCSIEQALRLIAPVPPSFFSLVQKFWPGPLTVVAPASEFVPLKVTGNTGKVGVRWPRCSAAEKLIAAVGVPLTGTSANLSDGPVCCTAAEVSGQIGESLPLILDGGPTPGNLPSTVIELVGERARLLREGAIPASKVEEFLT